MRLRTAFAPLLALALAMAPAAAVTPPPDPAARPLPDIVAPLLDAVVNITVLKAGEPQGATGAQRAAAWQAERSYGSGFLIDPSGIIVTNRHVIAGAFKITVTLHDERQFAARVVASNMTPDLALLRIEAPQPLPVVAWGDSDALRLGETVIAIGNPLGLSTTVTSGVVSATNRNVGSTVIDDFIQTDTPINPGNSGGPLFNLRGEVVGVNSAIVTVNAEGGSVGLGLSIPSATARQVVEEMRRHGRLEVGYPGFLLQPISPAMATVLGLPAARGGIVSEVTPLGPGARAGLREGDVVLRIGDHGMGDARAMLRQFADYPPGALMPLTLWRSGRELPMAIPMEVFPEQWDPAGGPATSDAPRPPETPTLGLRLSALDPATRRSFGITHTRPGLVVEGVAPYSTGAELGLARGDLILRVAETEVRTVPDFVAALARHRAPRGMLLQVEMRGTVKWIVMPAP